MSGVSKTFRVNKKREGLRGSIRGLFKREYVETQAVKNINFEVFQGECIGFIGLNGAGKTTTLKMLTGLIKPSSGEIEVLGYTPIQRSNKFRQRISLVMGNKFQLWWDIPAIESFQLQRKFYSIPILEFKERVDELCTLLNVNELMCIPVRNLSLGERMKMELIASLLHNPDILFLDEPTLGLDSLSQKKIRGFLKEINTKHKTTIIMTSHYMDDIESVCDRLLMISKGEIIYDGKKEVLVEAYQKELLLHVKFLEPMLESDLLQIAAIVDFNGEECTFRVTRDLYLSVIQRLLGTGKVRDFDMQLLPLESIVENYYESKEGVS